MAIVRWEPFRDLASLQDRMNRVFDESLRGMARPGEEDWALGGSWAPPVDIYEHEGNIVLKAELPGVDPKEVDVRLENNVLTLRGERKFERDEEKDSYHRIERAYGTFSRSFRLPTNVDTGSAKAAFDNGILTIELPKSEEARPRKLEIS